MEPINPGERVAVIKRNDDRNHICYLLGYGIYEGKFIPPTTIKNKKGKILGKLGKECCKFVLDNGEIYWDFESWFMLEERFVEVFINDCYKEDWRVIEIDFNGNLRNKK